MMIVVLPSFQFPTRLNSQNTKETTFVMNSDTLICIWILVFPIGIIEVSTPRNWNILFYFSSLHDYRHPTTWNPVVHTTLVEMERWVIRAYQLHKMLKKKISWHIKTKCLTDYLLIVNSTRMKDYTCHYGVST